MKPTRTYLRTTLLRFAPASLGFMRMSRSVALACVAGLGLTCYATIAASESNNAEPKLLAIIESIEQGWERGNSKPFREHFLDFEGARYIESGGQNVGLSDLIDHHVVPEGEALRDFDLTFSNIEINIENGFAWVIADVELVATLVRDERRIHSRGYETLLFREVDGEWKVVHTHSSSRPVKSDEEGHQH